MLQSPAVSKKHPLLASEQSTMTSITKSPPAKAKTVTAVERRKGKKVGEVAGGAAAECAAVCCCCPCTVMNLIFLAVYRVPTAVCKKAWRRKKRRRIKSSRQGLLKAASGGVGQKSVAYKSGGLLEDLTAEIESEENDTEDENDVVVLEKEMWDRFHDAGFWRSPSQIYTS